MKKTITLLLVCAMLCACSLACAAGVTVRTFTPFADMDFAAQGYMDLITAWEEETGNFAADYSGAMDELWMDQLRSMAASGEADLVILPAGSGLTHAQLLTVAELSALAPQLGVKVFPSMAEPDGSVLLSPLRLNWEALYVNTDVLAAHSLSLPASLEELTMVCSVLSAKGVLPIANAIGDWAEIALDCAALCGAPQAAYGSKASFDGAKDVMTMLAAVGAFGSDPLSMTDDEAMELFLSGAAAKRRAWSWARRASASPSRAAAPRIRRGLRRRFPCAGRSLTAMRCSARRAGCSARASRSSPAAQGTAPACSTTPTRTALTHGARRSSPPSQNKTTYTAAAAFQSGKRRPFYAPWFISFPAR